MLYSDEKPSPYVIRRIEPSDNADLEVIIKTVLAEFGAVGPGYAHADPEVSDMYSGYSQDRTAYFVIADGARILGGGGFAQLVGGDSTTCELRKLYMLSELRGFGLGKQLLDRCLQIARDMGFKRCYVETLQSMQQARALYAKNGFRFIDGPMGNTGHFKCDCWCVRDL
jgi:putative acetyltransferase